MTRKEIRRELLTRKEHACGLCEKTIGKGIKAYLYEVFLTGDDESGRFVHKYRSYLCVRCDYSSQRILARLRAFMPKCHHPVTHDEYSYIPGECVQQIECTRCDICKRRV